MNSLSPRHPDHTDLPRPPTLLYLTLSRPRSSSPGTEVVVGVNTDISNPSWFGKRALLPDDGLSGSTKIISWAFLWFELVPVFKHEYSFYNTLMPTVQLL